MAGEKIHIRERMYFMDTLHCWEPIRLQGSSVTSTWFYQIKGKIYEMLQNFNILVWVYCWQYENENYNVKAFVGKWKNKWTVCDITHKGKASVLTVVWMFLQKEDNKYITIWKWKFWWQQISWMENASLCAESSDKHNLGEMVNSVQNILNV